MSTRAIIKSAIRHRFERTMAGYKHMGMDATVLNDLRLDVVYGLNTNDIPRIITGILPVYNVSAQYIQSKYLPFKSICLRVVVQIDGTQYTEDCVGQFDYKKFDTSKLTIKDITL